MLIEVPAWLWPAVRWWPAVQRKEDGRCRDCGTSPGWAEYYMVTNAVWRAARMRRDGGQLCIGCLETRLGRQLNRADFSDAKINEPVTVYPQRESHKSDRLKDRLSRTGPGTSATDRAG